jgi:hypothetical protein
VIAVERAFRPQQETIPWLEGRPGLDDRVAFVTIRISSVYSGRSNEEVITFVAFVSLSIFEDEYEVGQGLVVGLKWGENVLGGYYWLFSEMTRFTRQGDEWRSIRGTAVSSPQQIRDHLQKSSGRETLARASSVIVGVVKGFSTQIIDGPNDTTANQLVMEVVVKDVLRGPPSDDTVKVYQITSGDYWPDWRYPAPFTAIPEPNDTLCFFLRRDAARYVIVGGVDGVFVVRGEGLFRGSARAPELGISDVRGGH